MVLQDVISGYNTVRGAMPTSNGDVPNLKVGFFHRVSRFLALWNFLCSAILIIHTYTLSPLACTAKDYPDRGTVESHCRALTLIRMIGPEEKTDHLALFWYHWIFFALFAIGHLFAAESWDMWEGGNVRRALRGKLADDDQKQKDARHIGIFINAFNVRGSFYMIKMLLCQLLMLTMWALNVRYLTLILNIESVWKLDSLKEKFLTPTQVRTVGMDPAGNLTYTQYFLRKNFQPTYSSLDTIFPRAFQCLSLHYGESGKKSIISNICYTPFNTYNEASHLLSYYVLLASIPIVVIALLNLIRIHCKTTMINRSLNKKLLCLLITQNVDDVTGNMIISALVTSPDTEQNASMWLSLFPCLRFQSMPNQPPLYDMNEMHEMEEMGPIVRNRARQAPQNLQQLE